MSGTTGAVLSDGAEVKEIGHRVGELGPGQCFGETSDMGGRREYTVVASKDRTTEVLRLHIPSALPLCRVQPRACHQPAHL